MSNGMDINVSGKNVFITGAGGFIGSALAARLAENGCTVYAILYSDKERENLPARKEIIPVVCDLLCRQDAAETVKHKIDIFYHLAWCGISSADYKNVDVQQKNAALSINAVKLAQAIGTRKFIFAGTNQEYLMSENSINGKDENASIYGVMKMCCRLICRNICKDKMQFNATAFTNVFGVGDRSKRTANLFIGKLLNGESLDLIEGNNLYDWTYIDDAVDGLISVGFKGVPGKQYYIGSRKLITFREIITNVRDIICPEAQLRFGKYSDPSYTDYSNFDLDALYNDTGFECKADFKESILKTAEWVKNIHAANCEQNVNRGGVIPLNKIFCTLENAVPKKGAAA